jgi:hypothetical protein|tara:strand:+ start:647 stop:1306 length:660 start_codon:yes stop_codon:yes gene_type:complete
MSTLNFDYYYLGQSIGKYQVPLDIFDSINHIYETKLSKLEPANKQLIGKIENEHSLLYNGNNESEMKRHNELPKNITNYFENVYRHYLDVNKVKGYKFSISSIWVNEMKKHEYNPVHIHRGTLFTGLSSVMILKLPNTFGKEYSVEDSPTNGVLEIMGSSSGQFAKMDYRPPLNVRDFYIFPYDMRHCVYPFNGTDETRRTLAANCDVQFDPTKNRGLA